ncbi:hypothetical protein SAMD00079811_70470 [Scytonema sp. HK-05]|nr:hypothetical protein SAMD00079811_70470 [Scytonema sp. HK-05]
MLGFVPQTPVACGGKPLRVSPSETLRERQSPAEGDPPAALVSPPATLAPQSTHASGF